MNCLEFRSILVDLTRPPATSNDPQTAVALSHAAACAACAERLAAERNLSQALRQYARSAVVPEAPAPHEAALRTVFREHFGNNTNAGAVLSLAVGWKPWAIAVAAMLLVTIGGIFALRSLPEPRPPESAVSAATTAPPQATVATAHPTPTQAVAEIRKPSKPEVRPAGVERTLQASSQKSPQLVAEAVNPSQQVAVAAASYDAASEFVPLLYGGDPMLTNSGPVVRVEISGAALQSLGFPIAGEPSARRIQADLMLGQDGLARAIRFVQ